MDVLFSFDGLTFVGVREFNAFFLTHENKGPMESVFQGLFNFFQYTSASIQHAPTQ